MRNSNLRFVQLFNSYLGDSLSNDERKEFLMYATSEKFKNKLLELIDSELKIRQVESANSIIDADLMWGKIVEEVKSRIAEQPQTSQPIRLRKFWWAAAAAIVLPAILFTFLYLHNENAVQMAGVGTGISTQIDILPGGNKALLILSDHSEILLDTAKTGIIVKQGSSSISKLGEGELAYHSEHSPKTEILYNTVVTPRGGQYQLKLPDGTKVWLNAASSIKFPTNFIEDKRIVEITGEVYFEVEHDPLKPFIVQTAQAKIEVLGTIFNINTYELEMSCATTLVEGSLRLTNSNNKESQILKPHQQAFINENGGINLKENADIETTIAWKNGYFQFKNTELESVMQQISRWYNVEINYERKPENIRLTGIISRKVNASSLLQMLELSGVNVTIENDVMTVK